MGYVLKVKKGMKLTSGKKTRGGCLRTAGSRAYVFDTKKQAKAALESNIKKWTKNKEKRKKYKNRMTIKKV